MDPPKQDDRASTKPHPPRKNPAQPHSVGGRPPRRLSTRADPKDKDDPPSSSSNRSRTTPSRQPPLARSSTSLSHHRPRASESAIPSSPAGNRLRRSTSSLSNSSRIDIVGSPRGSYIPRLKSATPSTSTAVKRERPQPQPQPKRDIYTQRPKKVARPSAATAQTPPEDNEMRQPMDLKAAFELAQQQEANANLSSDDSFDLNQAFQLASAEMNGRIDGSPSPAPRSFRGKRDQTNQSPFSHLQRFDSDHKVGRHSGPLDGLFGKPLEAGEGPYQFGSKENVDPEPRLWPALDIAPNNRYVAGPDEPLPSIEFEGANSINDEEIITPANASPEKSMNWHLDADFTAGDLQVSDSPRVRTAKSNAPDQETEDTPGPGTPGFRRSNSKLDQLREREAEVAKLSLAELDPTAVQRHNTKLDEIRASEHENFFSKRAIANSKLDEIRLRNAQARSVSPETPRNVTKTVQHQTPEGPDGASPTGDIRSKSVSPTPEQNAAKTSAATVIEKPKSESFLDSDSQDLLRRLEQATGNTPQPRKTSMKVEDQVPSDSAPIKKESEETEKPGPIEEPTQSEAPKSREQSRSRAYREERRSRNFEIKGPRDRPTVGFAGLKRTQSTDSLTDKRISMATSDIDTTARFEAEMRLFAPRDDFSEIGSIRASSPVLSELFEEDTPKPKRTDPLLLPTPRVTGGWIETPQTLRVKGEDSDDKIASDSLLHVSKTNSWFGGIGSGRLGRRDPSGEAQGASKARSSSVPANRPARSVVVPRRPQINTAKPFSVKEDLRAILQSNQIEDSTLDSFDHILNKHEVEPEAFEQSVNHELREVERNLNYPGASDKSLEDLEAYERMSKSVRGGLSGISSAKQGIDRLVNQVSAKSQAKEPEYPIKMEKAEFMQPKPVSVTAPIQINWSTVFSIKPDFKTRFGLLSKILIVWLALESAFAFFYAPPLDCFSTTDCDWSPNEPYFPYAMPFMLDEWSTGGKGRSFARAVGQQVGDVAAEVSDWATATDFTQLDQRYMTAYERKQHRRRLKKHGLGPTWVEPAQYQPRYAEWQASQAAREDAGIRYDDEFMSADETIM